VAVATLGACVTALFGCTSSHSPGDGEDAGTGGGGSTVDGSAGGGGGGGGSGGGGGGSVGSDAGPGSGGSGGGGGGDIDYLELCTTACDHLSVCSPEFDRLECISDCLGVDGSIDSAYCEELVLDVFECISTVPCDEVSEDLSRSRCAGVLAAFEEDCAEDDPPSAGGGSEPMP